MSALRQVFLVFLIHGVVFAGSLTAQRPTVKPNEPIAQERLRNIVGDFEGAKLSKDVHILWLFGPEDHQGGEHDYIRIKELFVPMLESIPRVVVDEAFRFPTAEQFEKADLLIQYLHLPNLSDQQFRSYQEFVERGGRVVSIHESCIIRPVDRAEKLAKCIGCSWNGNDRSRWSKFGYDHPLFIDTEHPAFVGLPSTILFNDESYWDLLETNDVKVIGAVAKKGERKSTFRQVLARRDVRSHAFWTYHRGKGKVFGTTTGHYTYTYHDPMYRLLLLRGIAWAIDEDPAPFMPIVFQGITSPEGLVGTTDDMMKYVNRVEP